MKKTLSFGRSMISEERPCYVIAEIGHNHQGNIDTAFELIKAAAAMGADAVKFQKRNNRRLYTQEMYNKPYEHENSYGATYGLHRDFVEFDLQKYQRLVQCAAENNVEFMSTPFDEDSVDFLEQLDVPAYKVASGDLTNTPLLEYIAKLGKPMLISTGASTLEEIHIAYETVARYQEQICLLHCTSGYPTDYEHLNLKGIETLRREFPEAVIGYSGHDNGILAPVLAYMLGASVVEKHFTLNRSWKGTDHKFSLEPAGMQKMVRDLRRVDTSLGNGVKVVQDFEEEARKKMGKSLYAARDLPAGAVIGEDDIVAKSPGDGMPPYRLSELLGKRLRVDMRTEEPFSTESVEVGDVTGSGGA